MDGTILDTERVSRVVWRLAALELGLMFSDELSEALVGLNAVSCSALLREHFGTDGHAEELSALAQVRYREHLDRHGVPQKAGLEPLIEFLRRHQMPMAVATSTISDLARHKLLNAGLLDHFSVVVGGDQVTHGKPAPDIFLQAASRLGIAPADCVAIEDSAPGLRAASAAGMIPVLIPDLRIPPPEVRALAHRVLTSLAEVPAVITDLLSSRVVSKTSA